MIEYNLPNFPLNKKENGIVKPKKDNNLIQVLVLTIIISSVFGFSAGLMSRDYLLSELRSFTEQQDLVDTNNGQVLSDDSYIPVTSQEKAITTVVKDISPAVVSIIISKDVPIIEQYYYNPFPDNFGDPFFDIQIPQYQQKGVENKQIGGGTGFIISEDGMVLTNKHVVLDKEADYTILTLDGEKFSAQVLARDPFQDVAILKIDQKEEGKVFPIVELGDSDKIEIGQTVIAIGYVLGKYQNTVSVGVVAGLGRTVSASGGGFYETLEDVIQTDAAINHGNSGGPLLNLRGEVIGINTAIDVEGQNIGFSVPINKAKQDIEQIKSTGKISYPFLGVRYVIIDDNVQEENNLQVDYGAWIVKGPNGEAAVVAGSAAGKAGLREKDIILEVNGEEINIDNPLSKVIKRYKPNDELTLKVLRGEQELVYNLVLEEINE